MKKTNYLQVIKNIKNGIIDPDYVNDNRKTIKILLIKKGHFIKELTHDPSLEIREAISNIKNPPEIYAWDPITTIRK